MSSNVNANKYYDDHEKVYCRICGKRVKRIVSHLRYIHEDVTKQEYIEQFPDAPLTSKESFNNQSNGIKEAYENDSKILKNRSKTRFLNKIDKLYKKFQQQCENNVVDWKNNLPFRTKSDFDTEFCNYLNVKNIKYVYLDTVTTHASTNSLRRTKEERKHFKAIRFLILLCQDFGKLKRGTFIDLKQNKSIDRDVKFKQHIMKKKPYIKIKTLYFKSDLWQRIRNKYSEIKVIQGKEQEIDFNDEARFNKNRNRVKDKKILLSDDEKVQCQICGKKFYIITATHLKQHNLTTQEYAEKFPDSLLKSKVLGKIHSQKISGKNHFNYGKHLDTEIKQKISNSVIENIKKSGLTKLKYNRRGISGFRDDIGLFVRSKLEANFIRILQFDNIDFEYEPKRFKLNEKIVVPDILLLNDFLNFKAGTFIELKGRISQKRRNFYNDVAKENNINLFVLSSNSEIWKKMIENYKHIIQNWEN